MTEQQTNEWINQLDDGSGSIDFATFHSVMVKHRHELSAPPTAEQVIEALSKFDLERNGTVSAEHLHNLLRQLSEPLSQDDVDALLLEIDIDGDGFLRIDDFVNHMLLTSTEQQ